MSKMETVSSKEAVSYRLGLVTAVATALAGSSKGTEDRISAETRLRYGPLPASRVLLRGRPYGLNLEALIRNGADKCRLDGT